MNIQHIEKEVSNNKCSSHEITSKKPGELKMMLMIEKNYKG